MVLTVSGTSTLNLQTLLLYFSLTDCTLTHPYIYYTFPLSIELDLFWYLTISQQSETCMPGLDTQE